MKKPIGYDQAIAKTGEFTQLPPGGYVCVIKKAQEYTTKTGKEALVLLIDIAEGEYQGHFQKSFDSSMKEDKKWPNGARYLQLTEGKSLDFFKGMITSIEKSNSNFIFDFDERKLSGKMIGCVFGREEYMKNDGTATFATKVMQIRSVEAIRDGVEPPEDKLLSSSNFSNHDSRLGEEIVFDDNDIPF